jgi:hypothetical protein
VNKGAGTLYHCVPLQKKRERKKRKEKKRKKKERNHRL